MGQSYWSKTYDSANFNSDNGFEILEYDSILIALSTSLSSTSPNKRIISIVAADSQNGERLWSTVIDSLATFNISSLNKEYGKIELFGRGINSMHNHTNAYRYRIIPSNGQLINTLNLPSTSYHNPKSLPNIRNGKYYYNAPSQDVNPLFYQYYAPLYGTQEIDSFLVNSPTDDLGRLGGKYAYTENNEIVYGIGTLLYPEIEEAASVRKTDTLGNTIWTTPLESHEDFPTIGDVIITPQNKIVTSWITDEGLDFFDATYPPVIICLDSIGNPLWETVLKGIGGGFNKSVHGLYATENGDIVGVGSDRDHFSDPDSLSTRGWIFRLSTDGKLLWSKTYEYPNDASPTQFLNDVVELPSSDLAVVGLDSKVRNLNGSVSFDPDIWIMRLTPQGECPGCNIISWDTEILTATEEALPPQERGVLPIEAIPSPASTEITLQHTYEPQQTNNYDVRLFDSKGSYIAQYPAINLPYTFDVQPLAPGHYFFQIIDADNKRAYTSPFLKL